MISEADLRRIARARLDDAVVLFRRGRYDAAAYLSGYAVELALKARIVRHLRQPGFPETAAEFRPFQSLKTHEFTTLIHYTGIEGRILARYGGEWNRMQMWSPDYRYRLVGTTSAADAQAMINAARTLVRVL
jgi:HEPN domain-containing protein